ncbi:stationary phase survival protein SurE [Alicyclobacillus tengchongensis]|nr:stationary phase survival protein SurE [Alicyclobacillus tengchongensis]
MRILISNDDGVEAQGIAALTQVAAQFGEVIVVAPDRQRSASSHGISLHRRLRVAKAQVAGAKAAYAVSGTPVDCCKWALATIHPETPFDLVLSGINAGANLATDVLYSGTVAIAGEAALQGVKAIALSHVGPPFDFAAAAQASAEVVRMLMPVAFPADTFISVNIPYVGEGKVWRQEDVIWTKLGVRRYHDVFTPELDADGEQVYRYGGDIIDEIGKGLVDLGVVRSGRISLTPLRYRFTDESFLAEWTNEI